MHDLQQLTSFLGWSTAINFVVLLIASIAVMTLRKMMLNIHSSMFGLDESVLAQEYFHYIANYKIAIFVFNLVPYLALRVMA